ncbi:DnaJ-domain-containing protein [Irpex rosettiformis]|uniref:DnaJ-domain-containing protein n=1 Tax=Irpex rosettiformis TaxID=378272 RepID=A0ACB8UEM2_9APHY|nr:DnaJ-domain-containing protein [Irpex rosettiformis]
MRLFLLLSVVAVLVTAALAWSKEDHEIFDLVSALEAAEGKGTTFYSWLDIPSTASSTEISRAYRKKSIQLHPDKNPGVKGAHERFSRLGVIAKILRDAEGRKRYDFFYKNGVPRWRGTGYYYSRFRPGLGTVLIFLTILTSALQYVVQSLNYKRDKKRVEEIVGQARSAAWGNKLTPGEGQRKVKINLGGKPRVDEDGNLIPGRMVDMVVEGSDVFFLDSDGSLHIVDDSTAIPPAIRRTWFVLLVTNLWDKYVPQRKSTEEGTAGTDEDDIDESQSGTEGSGTVTPKEGVNGVASRPGSGRGAATTMAGGRRRKAVRKK